METHFIELFVCSVSGFIYLVLFCLPVVFVLMSLVVLFGLQRLLFVCFLFYFWSVFMFLCFYVLGNSVFVSFYFISCTSFCMSYCWIEDDFVVCTCLGITLTCFSKSFLFCYFSFFTFLLYFFILVYVVVVPIDPKRLISYAHKISYTTSAPPDWHPKHPNARPPAPQEAEMRSGLLYKDVPSNPATASHTILFLVSVNSVISCYCFCSWLLFFSFCLFFFWGGGGV